MRQLTFVVSLCCALLIFVRPLHAENRFESNGFEILPIQSEGRIQPLETFARNLLQELTGKTALEAFSAAEWLAISVFSPERAVTIPVIRIDDTDLLHTLHLDVRKGYLFRLDEVDLSPVSAQLPELLTRRSKGGQLSAEESGILTLYEKVLIYTQLLRSFTYEASFETEEGTKNYVGLLPDMQNLEARVRAIATSKGNNLDEYTPEELQLVNLSAAFVVIREGGETNTLFKVIPGRLDSENRTWSAPWEIYTKGAGTPESGAFIEAWGQLRTAYLAKDQDAYMASIRHLQNLYLETSDLNVAETFSKLRLEAAYMKLKPFGWAFGFYLTALLGALLTQIFKDGSPRKACDFIFSSAYLAATAILGASILVRSYLLARPPVGTLYESLLFASLMIGIAGIFFDLLNKKQLYRVLAALLALFLLAVSFFALPDQHGLNVLQAVLNTQFWLATHVLCVTIGYGLCLLAAALAHVELGRAAFGRRENTQAGLQQTRLAAGFALLFMSVGTALGGIWADQSWGRFWGWDPKENGALLIVLWLVWLLHGLISRDLKERGFLLGVAATGIFVALSWFGVNLLNIGLHSYGFIDGVAQGLGLYILLQCVILGVLAVKSPAKNTTFKKVSG